MERLHESLEALRMFLESGGPVLWSVGLVAMLLGGMIFERGLFIRFSYPKFLQQQTADWHRRDDRSSRRARCIRDAIIAGASLRLRRPLPLIRVLVALCPLLGLLGTVTGMIQVFDTMAALGTGNARAMAAGISRAIIPTMAGMVVALPGLYFTLQLDGRIDQEIERLQDRLSPAGAA